MNSAVLSQASFSLRLLGLAGIALTLASCANRAGVSPEKAARVGSGTKTTGTVTLVANPKVQKVSTSPRNAAADRIVMLVETGKLVQSGDSYLVFVRSEPDSSASWPSLYEDAIALGQLRGKLKSVPGTPDSTCKGATVRNGAAVLPIKDSLPASTTANIVDSALTVDLVRSVRINLPTAPR
jgi:hypothetical protein